MKKERKEKIELLVGVLGLLLGITGTVMSLLSYRQANASIALARESEKLSRQAQSTAQHLEIDQYLADAWDLLGGQVGTTRIQNPTTDGAKLELARRLIQDKAMTLDSKNSKAYRYYGVYLYASGDPQAALRAFERALEIDPKDEAVQFDMARVKIELFNASR